MRYTVPGTDVSTLGPSSRKSVVPMLVTKYLSDVRALHNNPAHRIPPATPGAWDTAPETSYDGGFCPA